MISTLILMELLSNLIFHVNKETSITVQRAQRHSRPWAPIDTQSYDGDSRPRPRQSVRVLMEFLGFRSGFPS